MGANPTSAEPGRPNDLSNLCLAATENAPLPMAMVEGASHIVRYVNPAFCRLIDKSREQLVGRSFRQMVPDQEECVALLDRVFRTGKPEHHTEHQHSTSHPIFWSYAMWPVIENERPVGATIQVTETSQFHAKTLALNEALLLRSVRQHELTEAATAANALLQAEINERRRVEAALRASELNYRRLFETATDGILIVEAGSGRIIELNPCLIEMLGFSQAELAGGPIWELSPFKEIVSSQSALADLQKQGSVRCEPLPLETKTGGKVAVEFVCNVYQAGVRSVIQCNIRDITARKQAEMTSVRLAAIVESSDDAIIGNDLDGIITNWNSGAEKIFGYSAAEIVGTSMTRLIPADRRNEDEQILGTVREGRSIQHLETQRQTKDGRLLDISVTASPIKTATGRVIGVSIVARNISERKRAEQALRASEERFRALVTTTSDAVYRMNPDWSGLRQLHSRNFIGDPGKPSRLWLEEYILPEDQPGVRAAISEAIRTKRIFELEHRVRRVDNTLGWTFSRAIPLLDANGEIVEWFGAATDVTERKRAEEELRLSQARFSTVFRSGPVAMCINIVRDGRIIDANEQYCKLFGYSREELLGRSVLDFNLWANPEDRAPVMQRLLQEGAIRDLEARQRCRSGEIRDVLASLELIELADENEPVLISMFADITERKQAEEEVRRLNGELERRVAQRTMQLEDANRELEAFSYSVSHDLRAPLRHVLGFVDLLQQDAGARLSGKSLQYLTTISDAARRMGHLIDDLLSFSRIGKAEMQKTEVSLDQLVQEVSGEFKAETKDRNVVWEIQSLPAVRADRALLRLVLVNLISNAVKFTGHRPQPKIEIGCAPGGDGETVIFVRDNGAGFNPRYANKLFGVFQRLHSQADFEGTGIGLANVQRIIRRHGGRTWAEGAVDGGAAFYFSIPRQDGGMHGQ